MSDRTISDAERNFLRHSLATLAYRAGKSLAGAPAGFADYRANETARTPGQILAHMGDLFDWALSLAKGVETWNRSDVLPWDEEVDRFFRTLVDFDAYLESDARLASPADRLLQGPIADALTHVGQIALMRRMAGSPIRGGNYFRATIVVGQVQREQNVRKIESR